jgi:hypothetical protein
MAEKWHSGITMHKMSFGGGFVGFLFAIGSALIFVLGFPTLWYFVAFAAVLGVGIAIALRMFHRIRPDRHNPLSILATPPTDAPKSCDSINLRKSFRIAHVASA